MDLPFTKEAFFEIFSLYNTSVFPAQLILLLLAILCVSVIFFKLKKYNLFVYLTLSVFWLWMGLVYHIKFFSGINPAAKLFGTVFIVQSILFLTYAYKSGPAGGETSSLRHRVIGVFLITYSLFLYPLINILSGHNYPDMPTFGLPCPTTIFTFGVVFLLGIKKTPVYLLIIPVLWTFVGTTAAFKLGVPADFMLAATSTLYVVERIRKR